VRTRRTGDDVESLEKASALVDEREAQPRLLVGISLSPLEVQDS
jgi:hypothetical protein